MKRPAKHKISTKAAQRWKLTGRIFLWTLSVICIVGMFLACFGGNINPENFKGIELFILIMPAWLIAIAIVTILDAFWCRKAMVLCLLTILACANAIWNYMPLNFFGPSAEKYEKCPKFTLLSYNVANFKDLQDKYPDNTNPTLSYIIRTNADVVCLQETNPYYMTWPKSLHISPSQIDSLNNIYPYRVLYGGYLTVLSKYPVEPIHTPPIHADTTKQWQYYPIGVFRLNIEGLPVTLFNVHLRSYSLTADDKALYKNIADGKEIADAAEGSVKESLRDIKSQIFHKIHVAAVKRVEDAEILCRYIKRFGGPNVIIAGDFNDVPGCYTLNRLSELNFKQVYPKIGFGPMITFNADKFYFRIDHILYRGHLEPLKISRGSLKSSDHYPLVATFAITDN